MRSLSFVRVVGAGVVALALVAHVWMFDAPGAHGSSHVPAAATVAAAQAPIAAAGCAAGMAACEVPMPAEPLAPVLVSGLLAAVLFLGVTRRDLRAAPTGTGPSTDRAPPRRHPGASSVVLLV